MSPDDYQKKETVVLGVGATLTNRGAWYNEKKVRKKGKVKRGNKTKRQKRKAEPIA